MEPFVPFADPARNHIVVGVLGRTPQINLVPAVGLEGLLKDGGQLGCLLNH